mgnify:FL=1
MQTLQLSWPVQSIERAVAALWPGLAAEVLTQVDSTNTLLLERARAGLVQPTLVVAERQTAGRGRMGRQWVSHQPVGGSLTFSLSLPLGEGDLSGLSLVAGYSLAQALDMQHRHELRVKWPNDLWYRQRKLGGILIEICTQGRQRQAVIGVGINVAAPPPLPPGVAGQAAAQAPAWVQEFAPNATAPSVLEQVAVPLARAVHQFMAQGFAPWQQRFSARDALAGQAVWLSDGSTGTARGVGARGALLVQSGGVLREVHSADISVRPAGPAAPMAQ